jgi:ribulose-5-phosphate 4-epimerase/fuculose-1-phosphate aldolase
MSADDICVVDFDLKPVEDNGLKPSMETGMHVAVYRNRKDVGAVVHTHQIFASVFALINEPIPALFDEVAGSIGPLVEVVPYGLSGSPALIDNVTGKLGNRGNCYILQNHGALSLGSDLDRAKRNAELLEKCARVYYYALSTGREVTLLPENMRELMGKIVEGKQDAEIRRKEELKK